MRQVFRAFTLVEILIVVVILGILAGIVVPRFASATEESAEIATLDQLTKIRRAISVYYVQHENAYPSVAEGDGTWGEIIPLYMREAPVNAWVGGDNSRRIVTGGGADAGYHTDYGWVYDPVTGNVWAGGFSADDEPFDR